MQILLDPDALLDVAFDWSTWLAESETILSHTATASSGVTVDSSSEDAGIVTVWLTDGTAGTNPVVTCHIVTDGGREDDRSITVRVRER